MKPDSQKLTGRLDMDRILLFAILTPFLLICIVVLFFPLSSFLSTRLGFYYVFYLVLLIPVCCFVKERQRRMQKRLESSCVKEADDE
ncbi:MAG: hypothetical protein ACOX9C_13075 [Kiritimatiellia bacterium]|jgi:hypothetical protein